jgi:hypothetical protein
MEMIHFGFLADYFELRSFNRGEHPEIDELVQVSYGENVPQHEYAVCLFEKPTGTVLELCGLYSDGNKISRFESFGYYLDRLPGMDLHSVAFLFALLSGRPEKLDEPFTFGPGYPSEFAALYLKDTFGHVVYTDQFMELLSFCPPSEENNHDKRNEYRRLYNQKQGDFLEKLNQLTLPDGCSLYELMKMATPLRREHDAFGLLMEPNHKMAYTFVAAAKKYLR